MLLWFDQYFYVQCFYGLFNIIIISILFLARTVDGDLCVFLNVLVVALVLSMIAYRLFSLYRSCLLGAVLLSLSLSLSLSPSPSPSPSLFFLSVSHDAHLKNYWQIAYECIIYHIHYCINSFPAMVAIAFSWRYSSA